MASENIVERKIYRVLIDQLNKVWERVYFLTNAKSVDAEDGENLETKVGAIKGITTSTTVTENGWAMDAKTVNETLTGINTEMSALKKSVADAKNAIASALTSKGVTTSADASFNTMIANLNKINTGYKGQSANSIGYKDVTFEVKNRTDPSSSGEYTGHGRLDYTLTINDRYAAIIFTLENDRGNIGNNYDTINIASISGTTYRVIYQISSNFYICALTVPNPGTNIRFIIDFNQSSSTQQNNCVGRLRIWGLK